MKLIQMRSAEAGNIQSFLLTQDKRIRDAIKKFDGFERFIIQASATACRSTLIEAGFSPDDYPEEMQYYLKSLDSKNC